MPNTKNYWTTKRPDGWAVQKEGASRATSLHSTQDAAWKETRARAKTAHGEAYLQSKSGEIRERNTYGHDPRSTKG